MNSPLIALPSGDTFSGLLLKHICLLKQRFALDWSAIDFNPVNKNTMFL
jgi:hypothetical protein